MCLCPMQRPHLKLRPLRGSSLGCRDLEIGDDAADVHQTIPLSKLIIAKLERVNGRNVSDTRGDSSEAPRRRG